METAGKRESQRPNKPRKPRWLRISDRVWTRVPALAFPQCPSGLSRHSPRLQVVEHEREDDSPTLAVKPLAADRHLLVSCCGAPRDLVVGFLRRESRSWVRLMAR